VAFGVGAGVIPPFRDEKSIRPHKLPPGLIRRVLVFVKPYRGALVIFLLLTVADALITAAFPLIYRALIDDGIVARSDRMITSLAADAAGLAVIDAMLMLLQRWISARIGEGLVFDMRSKIFANILNMPIAFFSRTKTGALISRVNNDVVGARQAFTDTFASVVGSLVSVVVIFVAMVVLSWPIAVISLAALPVFVLSARWTGRKLSVTTREYYNLSAEMSVTMAERFNVAGALLAKLYSRRHDETRTLTRKARRVRDIGIVQAMYVRAFMVVLLLTASLATALVYGVGGILVVHGEFPVGTMVALAAYLTRLYTPLTSLSNVQIDITTALVAFDRIFEVIDLSPMISERKGAVPIPRGPATIEFDRVCFSYPRAEDVSLASLESVATLESAPQEQVLSDISFTVMPGEMVALVGPSGAGKSTISYLASRLYDVQSGAVRINGIDVRDATFESLSSVIGAVTQDVHLFHDTLRSNLRLAGPGATDNELNQALSAAQILPLIESLPEGLDTVVGERGYRLSGGQKQRIAIARLLLKKPDIVILDEATAHLDSASEMEVTRALRAALTGRTSLVIAHRLSTVQEADLILVVVDGRIAERGTHAALLAANGKYAEIYRTQFAGQATAQAPIAMKQLFTADLAGSARGRHRRINGHA
jgi:ATP-binding cassette subfamily B protein